MANTNRKKPHVVGFTIHEAKELSQTGEAVDPVCVARCMHLEYTTELKRGKLSHVKFEESYIWNDLILTEEEFRMAYIEFELQSANTFFRNDIIGTGKVQLAMVRMRPNHTYNKKWLNLVGENTSSKLRVSVFCYAEGDTPPKPDDGDDDVEEKERHMDNLGAALVGTDTPTGVADHRMAYHLFVHIHRVNDLVAQGGQSPNPYVTVEFNGHEQKTQVAINTSNANLDECFRIPVVTPIFADSIVIRIMSQESWPKTDKLLIQGRISFSLLRMHAMQAKWFNFYGFSEEEVGDIDALFASHEKPEENFFLGRLLVSGRVQKVPNVDDLQKAGTVKGQIFQEPPSVKVYLMLDAFEISSCLGSEAQVKIRVGTFEKKTKVVKRSKDSNPDPNEPGRFIFDSEKGRCNVLAVLLSADTSNQMDAVVSLYANLEASSHTTGGMQRVGFRRYKIADITKWKGDMGAPRWLAFKPMAHQPSSVEPGQVMMSLYQASELVSERGMPNCKPMPFELRAFCMMARNLHSLHGEIAHAYCSFTCAGVTAKTEVAPPSNHPSWLQTLSMDIVLQASPEDHRVFPEPIQVLVYDDIEAKEFDVMAELENRKAVAAESLQNQSDAGLFDISGEVSKKMQKQMERTAQAQVDKLNAAAFDDMMAKKRLGAGVGGKQLIGRTSVVFTRILKPSNLELHGRIMRPKWVQLRGGVTGSGHSGDILMGFMLMKKKYSDRIPPVPMSPEGTKCMVSIAILGLRDIPTRTDRKGKEVEATKEPRIDLEIPQPSLTDLKEPLTQSIQWSVLPPEQISNDDKNRKWIQNKASGHEFLDVRHIEATLPSDPNWDPVMKVKLIGDLEYKKKKDDAGPGPQNVLLGEGNIRLLDHMTWISRKQAKRVKDALEHFELDSDEGEEDDNELGVLVSEDEDGEAQESGSYVTVRIDQEPIKAWFNASDVKSFPPVLAGLDATSKCRAAGVNMGDVMVGYKTPSDKQRVSCPRWSPKKAQAFFADMDKKQIRPLELYFRKRTRAEVIVRLAKDTPLGLVCKEDSETKPPQVLNDSSPNQFWRAAGVAPNWRIIDIDGTSTEDMAFMDGSFQALLQNKPAFFILNAMGKITHTSKKEEEALQASKPCNLSGVAKVVKQIKAMKQATPDGCLKDSRASKPTIELPPMGDTKHLVMRVARGTLVDVRGLVRLVSGAQKQAAQNDILQRASVAGKLEDYMPKTDYLKTVITNGEEKVAVMKFRLMVVSPPSADWFKQPPYSTTVDKQIFDPRTFRLRHKQEIPTSLRIRTYIVRALNVSGAQSGSGNPYIFFRCGGSLIGYQGKVKPGEMEPRFFHTEEHDVQLPEQATFVAGLYDHQDGAEDLLIGQTEIDLEDRWYTTVYREEHMRWNAVPIEYRPLIQDSSSTLCKGVLEMWMEILDSTKTSDVPVSALFEPPPTEVEVRCVIFGFKHVSRRLCVDDAHTERETVDVSCRCELQSRAYKGSQPVMQETDTHYGCESELEYNWRCVWSKIQVARGVSLDCFLQISLWEQFSMSQPRLMCEALLDVKNYCKAVSSSGNMIEMSAELPLSNP